ncbi:gp53-like domain-containing protein [Piscirickettsia litoralis]|uniref:Uncharacterized protein n=1 Tax=Piscirickettsia litoralis TaxID=1891921 RepID=A0ABX2ZWT0_9GAMM|nr:hypothetical protein [Piscirickettsia litoralis]ODN41082.1 hypothetical protein BGC07_18220 [Piscirickettsia litoralis]
MSLERPTTYPDFAMKDCTDPISGQPNVEEIPQKLIDYGYAFRDKPEFNKFNYIFRSVAQWIRYVDEVTQSFGYLPFNFGKDATTTTGLIFGYLQGSVTQNNESITVPAGTVTLTANKTNIVYVDLTDTKVKATTSPLSDDANDVELYDITTDATQITNIVDKRTWINETASHQINWGNSSVAVKSQNGEVDVNVAGSTVFKATNSLVISNNPFKPQSGLVFADNTTQNTAAYNLPNYDGTARALSPDDDLNNLFKTGIYCGVPKNNPVNDQDPGGEWFNFFIMGDGKNSASQFAIPWSNLSRGVSVRTTQSGADGWSEWEQLNTQDKIYSAGKSQVSFDSSNAICFYYENKKVASINNNGLTFSDGSTQKVASPAVAKDYNGVTCGIYVDSLGDWNLVNQTGFFVCTNTSMKNGPTLTSTKGHWWTCHVVRVPNSSDLTQTITSLATDDTAPTFVRQYTAGCGWTSWQRIDYSMVANDARTINIANGDANNFKDKAAHYSGTSTGWKNAPSNLGILSVYPYSDNPGCYQEFVGFEDGSYSSHNKYCRMLARDGKTWSDWILITPQLVTKEQYCNNIYNWNGATKTQFIRSYSAQNQPVGGNVFFTGINLFLDDKQHKVTGQLAIRDNGETFTRAQVISSSDNPADKNYSQWLRNDNSPSGIKSDTLNRTQNKDGSLQVEVKKASQSDVESGTDTNSFITPEVLHDFLNQAKFSDKRNGYLRLPDWLGGFLVQWGLLDMPKEGSTETFPIEFSSVYSVTATKISTPNPNAGRFNTSIYNISKTQFTVAFDVGGVGGTAFDDLTGVYGVSWLAIGK